jgi:TolB protein
MVADDAGPVNARAVLDSRGGNVGAPRFAVAALSVFALAALNGAGPAVPQGTVRPGETPEPPYTIAFASFAPLNSDIFVAAADGSEAKPLLPHGDLDYNASFSRDGGWVVFTSERQGSSDVFRAHLDGSGLERLTDDAAFDDQGALSPDGRFLAFVSSRSGQADIWILALESRTLRNLTSHPAGDFRPSWSPDGQWIAFSSDRDSTKPKGLAGFDTQHSTEIYLVRPDGSGLRRVTHAQAFAGSPTWSPDSKRLLFYEAEQKEVWNVVSVRRLRATTQIAAVDVQTNERKVLTAGAGEKWSPQWLQDDRIGYVSGGPNGGLEFTTGGAGSRGEFGSPSWSADGRRMVFHRDVDREWPPLRAWHSLDSGFSLVRAGVFPSYSPTGDRLLTNDQTAGALHNSVLIMNADGARRSVLFRDEKRSALGPLWSPRGDKIAFALGWFFQRVQGPAVADIAVIRADGTNLQLVTDGSGNHGFPSWSPDGRRLVYRTSTGERSGLSIVDTETGDVKDLDTGGTKENFPAWSPLGDRIAFTSHRNGDYEIYTIKPDGTDLRRLTNSPGNDAHCSWSPDGQWIAFASARGGFKDEAVLHPYNPQPYGDLYVMRADGSDVRRLTDNQYEEATPGWSPLRQKPRPRRH